MRVLVINAGSSSVKIRVVDHDDQISAEADLGAPGADLADGLAEFVDGAGALDAAGHRVVHGGERFSDPVIIDDDVRRDLDTVSALAPLHNPAALSAIDTLGRLRPGLTSIACFDTGFHRGLPAEATRYALPAEWITRWGIRRYGFHGLSCTWAIHKAAELLGWAAGDHRLVVCHLGAGASVTGVVDGRSVDTTMGFTPLEGLVMATRPGDVDPGAIIWLLRHGISVDELDGALEFRSGLAALSGESTGNMRNLLDRRDHRDAPATLAIGVYLHRLRAKIAAMTSAMEGLDALIFTGGVGENSPVIRAETAAGLSWLGVSVDETANSAAIGKDAEISASGSAVKTLVIRAREELVIAAACRRLLGGDT